MVEFEDNQLDAEVAIGDEIVGVGNKFRSLVRRLESNLDIYLTMRSWDKLDPNDEIFKSARSTVVVNVDIDGDTYLHELNSIVSDYKAILDKYIDVQK